MYKDDRNYATGEVVGHRFLGEEMEVRPEWIDFNGHLNMAYYGVLFDYGCGHGFGALGLGAEYRAQGHYTSMTADFRIRYVRELMLGDRVRSSFHIVKVGPKSFHFVQELVHSDGWVAATAETVNLNVDARARRVAPYPPDRQQAMRAMAELHATWPLPDWVGAPFGVRG